MTQHQEPVLVAAAFIFFWIVTLEPSVNSLALYLLRSVVVAAYVLNSLRYDLQFVSLAEMTADWLIMFHWIGLVQVFLLPDPRFRRRVRSER